MQIINTDLRFRHGFTTRKSTKRIILHHSATEKNSVEEIHNFHKNNNGWNGIGYHFYVRKDGKIYRGRPENAVGAHAGNHNHDTIGICFEGNFELETMPKKQIIAGNELVNMLKKKYNISKVLAHKDVNATAYPGKNFPFGAIAMTFNIAETKEILRKVLADNANNPDLDYNRDSKVDVRDAKLILDIVDKNT
ncbi:MAG TPA: N-acetylmuramoyl-L-alanine amidase [Clostridiales bacterium]|nr:N-acetylmuramoyl-L-alanine amidase [Clostridiales bacterium]